VVLAEAQAAHAPAAEAPEAPETSVEPSMLEAMEDEGEMVEYETTDKNGNKRTRKLSWEDAIKRADPEIAALMRGMQRDYTKKRQADADKHREWMREREVLSRAADRLAELEAKREQMEWDPFNPDAVNNIIESMVAQRLQDVLEPMQQEYQTIQAEDSYKAFLSANPDFETDIGLRSEVQHLLEGNPALDLETAYAAAKGKQLMAEAKSAKAQRAADRKARKEAALTATAPARRQTNRNLPGRANMRRMSNADILEMAKAAHRNR
tara:strand:- start:837 stop:1634 length:798 start_codon:yes stop_codon:yes gene_type:complete